jgi:hypothetical protein
MLAGCRPKHTVALLASYPSSSIRKLHSGGVTLAGGSHCWYLTAHHGDSQDDKPLEVGVGVDYEDRDVIASVSPSWRSTTRKSAVVAP